MPSSMQVYMSPGPKWKLVYDLYSKPEWDELAKGARAVMVPDDDLEMDTCTLNRSGCPAAPWLSALHCTTWLASSSGVILL